MAERNEYTITEAGYDAMAAARMRASFARERRSGQWQDIEITPAGRAAMRAYEQQGGAVAARVAHNHEVVGASPAPASKLAHATAQAAASPVGAQPPCRLAAASPERPAAAADF